MLHSSGITQLYEIVGIILLAIAKWKRDINVLYLIHNTYAIFGKSK